MPPDLDPAYVDGAIVPFLESSRYAGGTPLLPMLDLALSKDRALGPHLWGLLYSGWEPDPAREGTTVFAQRYEDRGPDNRRKRIYMSATTPDLYDTAYRGKFLVFLDSLLAGANAGRPLLREYFAHYPDLFWDLHVGATGDAIPWEVREFGTAFDTVLGHGTPLDRTVHDAYLRARALHPSVRSWIDARVRDVADGRTGHPERTLAYYWIRNGALDEHFRREDIAIECLHDLMAMGQWSLTVHRTASRLRPTGGEPAVRAWFERTMAGTPDHPDGCAFTPLDRFVMELLRTAPPNPASLSTLQPQERPLFRGQAAVTTPHGPANTDPRLWPHPDEFDPDRFRTAPLGGDDDRATRAGLTGCPFPPSPFPVRDGRAVTLTNSVFGAVYSPAAPICDTAGYASFGFGYRRCPAEHLTVAFLKDFLRRVWRDALTFTTLDLATPQRLPAGTTVVEDNITFTSLSSM